MALALVTVMGVGGWLVFGPDPDAEYLERLRADGLFEELGSEPAALAHAKGFCAKLEGGAKPEGFRSERLAAEVYCPDFLAGFTVVPTPKEQEATYLQAMRDGGFGGEYASDAAAVAAARAVCTRLESGGAAQGPPVEAVGLPVYCPEFAAGFKVLETITVEGSVTLRDFSYYNSGIFSTSSGCTGAGGYSDIGAGTQVIVRDGDGETLARTELGRGSGSSYVCEFPFTFDVLEGADDYVITVSRRGEVHFSFTQLKEDGAQLSLGS